MSAETAQQPSEERGLSLPVAIGIIVLALGVIVAAGVAVGYRFFWGGGYEGPKVWDVETARWEFNVKKNPKDVEAWAQLGYAYLQKGDLLQAEKAYRKALQLAPQEQELNYFLGQVKLKQKDFVEAEKLLKKAADVAPGNPLPHYGLAEVYMNLKKYDEALSKLNYIIEKIDPTLTEVLFLRGAAYEAKGIKDKAIASYKDALRYDPAFRDARDALHRLGIKDKDLPAMPVEGAFKPGEITPINPKK